MHARDLTGTERSVLFALLAHIAEADGRIDPGEVLELDALAEEIGVSDLREEITRTRAVIRTRAELEREIRKVDRPDARELILTLLADLAQADGARGDEEQAILDDVRKAWL